MATLTVTAVLALGLTVSTGYADPTPVGSGRQLASDRQQLEIVAERYDAARDQWRGTVAQLNRATTALGPLTAQVQTEQAEIGQEASALYEGGDVGGIAKVLSSRSPTDMMSSLATLSHLNWVRRRQLWTLRDNQHRVQQQQSSLRALSQQQSAQWNALGNQKRTLLADIAHLHGMAPVPAPVDRDGPSAHTPAAALKDGFVPPSGPDPASRAVRFAFSQLGKTYQYAAEGPNAYDCSGLTMAAWKSAGIALPHNAAEQHGHVSSVDRDDLRPGDLVFYYRDIHHVAIYVGDGEVIEAPTYGEPISMRPMDEQPISGFGRVAD